MTQQPSLSPPFAHPHATKIAEYLTLFVTTRSTTLIYLKMILWRCFFYVAAAFAGFDRRRVRCCLTDTDSFILSTSRELHEYEKRELKRIQHDNIVNQSNVAYDETNIAIESAQLYYSVFRNILDPSNLDQG